ncbi:MAG TPA: glycerol-3-phosphate dehydrogenase, partial [Burkholderiaceae bacterium]
MNITIFGAGAWGTALALALAERNAVFLWGRDASAMANAADKRENAVYLPGFSLPPALTISADFEAALAHVASPDSLLIAATSVAGLRPLLQ